MYVKKIIAIVLLIYAIFGKGWLDYFDINKPPIEPIQESILNIDVPENDTIERVKVFAELITDPSDKAKIAIFNYEFANRVMNWEISTQQVNDIYTLAGTKFFKNTIVNKYENLAEELVKLLEEIIGTENHTLTEGEKQQLNKYFIGIAWVLIQKA